MSEFDPTTPHPLPDDPAPASPIDPTVPPSDAPTDASAASEEPANVESIEPPPELSREASPDPVADIPEETPAAPLDESPAEPFPRKHRFQRPSAETQLSRASKVYAVVVSIIALLLIGMLLLLFSTMRQARFTYIPRSGITAPADPGEAIVGVEQAKQSVVVLESQTSTGTSIGTGIVISENGYIATNHHVIESARSIRVKFYDGFVIAADVIGSSEADDLAVIKVARTGLVPATFAYSEDCYVGQTVYAIGTPASTAYGWTTTKGIISYKNREVKVYDETTGEITRRLRLLQTDANVNPGNSGGPLVNTKGEVVGVVSMKLADGYEGIGFAIPSDGAVEILDAIVEFGNADNINSSLHHKRPMLGITGVYVDSGEYYLPNETGVKRLTEEELAGYDKSELIHPAVSGVYVMGFADGMDAATKMEVGDIITACQGEEITSMNVLSGIINEYYAGDTITLTVYRGDLYTPVDIVLSAQPES